MKQEPLADNRFHFDQLILKWIKYEKHSEINRITENVS